MVQGPEKDRGSTPYHTPEIDPAMLRTGVLLLIAGILVLTEERRHRRS